MEGAVMKSLGLVALGVVGGYVLAQLLIQPGNCCDRVGGAVREKVVDALGPLGGDVFDVLGLRKVAPGLLNLFGVS
jgi:hypothetical protein